MPQISLAAARVNVGLTQEEVAKAIKVSKTTIINGEKGKSSPRYSQMIQLCELYHMPMDCIFLPSNLPKVENEKQSRE